jgi:YidC/Oxa1 family membrane protein insertase
VDAILFPPGGTLNRKLCLFLALLSLFSVGLARVSFEIREFSASDFRNPQLLDTLCQGEADSFWCEARDAELQLITSKALDYIFSETGELVAVYTKQQRGQDFGGNYAVDGGQNLIPHTAEIPGGAVLIDGEYRTPTDVTSSWEETRYDDAPALTGTFNYRLGDLQVEKTVVVSSVRNSLGVSLEVARTAPGDEAVLVQYAFPGIARQESPVIKVGQGENFTLNPVPQPVADPNYISIQSNNRNTGQALVLRPNPNVPGAGGDALLATPLSSSQVAMGKTLAPSADAQVNLELQTYAGPNEMVRFQQEGYLDLPGLFNPNILGRLSLGIIVVLQAIHGVVGSWGLSIILLTLLFRLLVWPLIHVQMKSMVGMQGLQPKLQELQKKHKNDREKLTQETMKLYQEAGVNPAGGCLPALIQMPIFIILWRVFINFEFNEGFLWIPDLGLNDPLYLLPLLYIGIMVAQAFVSAKGNRQMLQQQLLISGVFVFFVFTFPAGVTLYLITSMLVQVFQQWLIQRSVAPAAPVLATGVTPVPAPAPAEASPKAAPKSGSKSNSGGKTRGKARAKAK